MAQETKAVRHRCSVCKQSETLEDVNVALVQGQALRVIGETFGLSYSALFRHKNSCIRALFETEDAKSSISVRAQLNELRAGTNIVLEHAIQERDFKLYLQAADRAAKQIELLGKLVGEIAQDIPVNPAHQANDVKRLLLEQLAEERGETIIGPVTELKEGIA